MMSKSCSPPDVISSVSSQEKIALRHELRQRRKAIDPIERQKAARAMVRHARHWLKRGRRIAVYIAVGSEMPTDRLIKQALVRGCQVFVPKVPHHGRQLRFAHIEANTHWQMGRYAIPEPVLRRRQQWLHPRRLDLVFVPMLGFDAALTRMGQGGGYYDASFAFRRYTVHPRLIGLAFACQQVDALPTETWDLSLDAVLTERGVLRSVR